MTDKLTNILGKDPVTTICGLLAIGFAGAALLFGKCSFEQFMSAVSVIAAGWGLIKAKDSSKE